jgi:hypothetical protein
MWHVFSRVLFGGCARDDLNDHSPESGSARVRAVTSGDSARRKPSDIEMFRRRESAWS